MQPRHNLSFPALALLSACLAMALASCGTKRKANKSVDEPGPVPVGEPVTSVEDANDEARAARAEEERAERLDKLRARLPAEPADALWERGESKEGTQDFKDAADAFTALVLHHPDDPRAPKATMRAMTARFRMGNYGDGLTLGEDALTLIADEVERARLQRVVGNAYLSIPHWGTERGGSFLRGQWGQGIQTHRFRTDRQRAIEHLEAARAVLAAKVGAGNGVKLEERVAVQFDLIGAIARFTPFDAAWHYFWYAWPESADDDKVEEEGADERAGRHGRWYGGGVWYALQQHKPRGLEVSTDGDVVFVDRPDAYSADLNTTAKLKFLLNEIVALDSTDDKRHASASLLRQGLLMRARDGSERLQRLGQWWSGSGQPYKEEVEERPLHTLADDEVLGLVATHLQVYQVPQDESFLGIMRALQRQYPDSEAADQAGFLIGQYYQSRAQYDRARKAYRAHIERYPGGTHVSSSRSALNTLEAPELSIVDMGVQPAGRSAVLSVKFRNMNAVRFTVRQVDLDALTRDFKKQYRDGRTSRNWNTNIPEPRQLGWYLHNDQNGALKRYGTIAVDGLAGGFERKLSPDASGRYAEAKLKTPLEQPGLYVIEAFEPGSKTDKQTMLSRGLVLIEKFAQVSKPGPKGNLSWIVDARTGEPVVGAKVEVFEYWNDWKSDKITYRSRTRTLTSDASGLIKVGDNLRSNITIVRHGGQTSFTGYSYGWGRYYPNHHHDATTALVMTDRPVYRPGDSVDIKVWARIKNQGQYLPARDVQRIRVRVFDPQGNKLQDEYHKATEFGAVHVKQALEAGAPLGMYNITIEVDGRWTRAGGGNFRVEEYKPPEFTVKVESAGQARLGEKVPAKISAEYLFGGAVTDAKVRYRVYRQDYRHEYTIPGIWDWLYGAGYGRCFYVYGWLGWWLDTPAPVVWYPWWGPAPEPDKELVSEGEGRLDADGNLEFDIDTAPALRDYGKTDHRYIIEAEVTDLSRRLIASQGEILVTRAGYFAHVEVDRGFYFAGDEVEVHVATQKTDGSLFARTGELRVERVQYQAANGDTTTENTIDTLKVETRAEAPVRMSWRAPATGLYKFTFVGLDDSGREVRSSALAWVAGPGFHGRDYRFRGLELYTDKRTYKVGDTVKLLVNANRENAHVLISTRAENGHLLQPQVIQLAGKSTVIEVPIEAGDVPNFFIEAMTVSDGELITEVREVFVPPAGTELNVEIDGMKDEYRPGEEVELTVRTKDADGQPVAADVALAVYDSAVLYIQPTLTPAARAHFWAVRRTHRVGGQSNLDLRFAFGDRLQHPDRQAAWQLGSLAGTFMQNETDWRRRDGKLNGGTELDLGLRKVGGEGDMAAAEQTLAQAPMGSASLSGKRESKASSATSGPAAQPAADASTSRDQDELTDNRYRAKERGKDKNKDLQRNAEKRPARGVGSDASQKPVSAARVRRNFADTAHFAPSVRTGASGEAKVRFTLPDNLTTWKVKAIGLDGVARVGESEAQFLSSKDLLIRVQAPRFFRERDRVVLSAIVHNKVKRQRQAKVTLRVPEALLAPEGETTRSVTVPAMGDTRVDFWVKVKGEGTAPVRMDVVESGARASDSDAKEIALPVLVHGLQKTVAQVGSITMGEGQAEQTLTLSIPADRREAQSRLDVRFSPSLAGGMLDALPYLLDYPYGCTEQTLSRFVPAVLTRKALQKSGGLKLEDLAGATNLNPQELTPGGQHSTARSEHQHQRFLRGPVFDQALMNRMIRAGVKRIAKMQAPDGGWGWWGRDGSSRYTTAHVVDGLLDAQSADVKLPPGMLDRGKAALQQLVEASLYRYDEHNWVGNDDAYAAYVMSRYKVRNDKLMEYLFERRRKLSLYGKVLTALAFDNLADEKRDDKKRARTLLSNAEQALHEDAENQTSWLETRTEGWWYWWNSDIETNARYLQALDQMGTQVAGASGPSGDADKDSSQRAAGVVKWLLNNRQNGYYWRSTRDSARVVAAFASHMQKSGEGDPDMDVEILLDGEPIHSVHVDKSNLFTYASGVALEGKALTTGEHRLTIRRKSGRGAVYFNSYLSYFSTEEDVQKTGLEVKVERQYYKLVRDDRELTRSGDRGQTVKARQVAYRKLRLDSGAEVESGDLVLVELTLESKNDYTFLAFEDPKPAGMETVALRSGTTYGEAVANMELRSDRVVFFLRHLHRGKLHLSYRLRAEIPGQFHAMPTYGFGMYAPELRTNSDEMRVSIAEARDE